MLSVQTTPEEIKKTTNTAHFGFVFVENSQMIIVTPSFSKSSVFKMLSGHSFFWFEERFRKAPFSRRSVDSRLNRRKKAAFSNSSAVVDAASV